MGSYHIVKDGLHLTGNISTGRYEWTKNKEFRYTFGHDQAESIVKFFPGAEIIPETTET